MGLKNKTDELAAALKATAEFAELKQAKSAIDRNRGLKSQFEDMKRRQTAFYSGRLSAKEAEAGLAELDKAFGQLSAIPEFSRYMEAAKKFRG